MQDTKKCIIPVTLFAAPRYGDSLAGEKQGSYRGQNPHCK